LFWNVSPVSVQITDNVDAGSFAVRIFIIHTPGWLGATRLRRRRAWVQIAAATLSDNSFRQIVHTHRASVHQAAKLVVALLRVARVTAGVAKSNGSLSPGL